MTAAHHILSRDSVAQALFLGAFVRRKAREYATGQTTLPIRQRRYAAVTGTGRHSPHGWIYLCEEAA